MWQVDGLVQLASTLASLALTQTSLAEDLEIWASSEFDYADLAEVWQKFSKEIGGSLMSVVNGTGKDMDGLQKTWNDYYSKVEREMVQLASDVGMSYQQLYIRFFEQQSEALNSLGLWWQTAVETTRKQLGDLQRRP